jgi:hypothetical protein
MPSDTVTISRKEYQRLKRLEKIDRNIIEQLVESIEDVKAGRIKRVA